MNTKIPEKINVILESATEELASALKSAWNTRSQYDKNNLNDLATIDSISEDEWVNFVDKIKKTIPERLQSLYPIKFLIIRDCVNHKLKIMLAIDLYKMKSFLIKKGAITDLIVKTVDEKDTFQYRGPRSAVGHNESTKKSGKEQGAYITYTLSDSSNFTVTMSPEEMKQAKIIWRDKVCGGISPYNDDEFALFLVMFRSLKLLSVNGALSMAPELEKLISNLYAYYQEIFKSHEVSVSNKQSNLAPSAQCSRVVSSQPSKLEEKIQNMKTKEEFKKVVSLPKTVDVEKNLPSQESGLITQFGVW